MLSHKSMLQARQRAPPIHCSRKPRQCPDKRNCELHDSATAGRANSPATFAERHANNGCYPFVSLTGECCLLQFSANW